MGQSLYGMFGQRVLGLTTVRENVQIRDGHGRMGELFSNSEDAGIAFAMTLLSECVAGLPEESPGIL